MACWCAGKCPHLGAFLGLIHGNKLVQADQALKRLLTENPGCGEAHKAMAFVLVEQNRSKSAIYHIDQARAILGPLPPILTDRASVLRNAVHLAPAIEAGREAVHLAPDNPQNWAILASNLQADGRLDEMDSVLAQARDKFGANSAALARVFAMARVERKDFAGAVEILNGSAVPCETDALSLYERGRCFEKLGEYEKAWRDWMRAKQMQQAAGMVWDKAKAERRFAMLADSARPGRFRGLPSARCDGAGARPIFITGLPRSGTTMIEAALSAHARIAGGDELMALPDVIQAAPALLGVRLAYPLALGALRLAENAAAPDLLRELYLRKALQKIGNGKVFDWFTDKMPSNEQHWPLISLLFPDSPIIATRRHPLDVLVSNMSHHLVHGAFISCGLESFAATLVMVEKLHRLYLEKIPRLRAQVRQVPYESLVADLQAGIDSLLPPGLAPDPACYDFHLSPFRSRTISHRQIKQKVNDSSIGRYKPFLEFLAPVLPQLAPVIERQGYGI